MEEVTETFTNLVSTTISRIYISNSIGALGKCEKKSSPTDVVEVRHVLKQGTLD